MVLGRTEEREAALLELFMFLFMPVKSADFRVSSLNFNNLSHIFSETDG